LFLFSRVFAYFAGNCFFVSFASKFVLQSPQKEVKVMKRRLLFILCFTLGVANLAFGQNRTVTNADLEKFRQKRTAAERDYRENYAKKGFPSPEELERQIEEDRVRNLELSERLRAERLEGEGDFKERAYALKSEIASVEAQIKYLRGQMPVFSPLFTGVTAVSVYPGRGYGYYGGQPPIRHRAPRSGVSIRTGTLPSRVYQPGNTRPPFNAGQMANVRVGVPGGVGYTGGNYGNYNHRRYRKPYGYGYGYGYYFPPVIVDRTDYTREELAARIQELEQQRAGLLAEWRVLEEEARRAGVRID
jgi:hypothetical protein